MILSEMETLGEPVLILTLTQSPRTSLGQLFLLGLIFSLSSLKFYRGGSRQADQLIHMKGTMA